MVLVCLECRQVVLSFTSCMIHSSSLETAETRNLRQEFLNHVRKTTVLKTTRSHTAGSDSINAAKQSRVRGPPPFADANTFSGRPPSPSLADEVKFVVCNSIPASQRANMQPPGNSPKLLKQSTVAHASMSLESVASPARSSSGGSSYRQLEASGLALHGTRTLCVSPCYIHVEKCALFNSTLT